MKTRVSSFISTNTQCQDTDGEKQIKYYTKLLLFGSAIKLKKQADKCYRN